ncbi:hypothetical protein GCM10027592_15470 [Spirosoma flavus]
MNQPATYSQTGYHNLQDVGGFVEIHFKGKLLRLSQQEINTLLSGLSTAWTVLYQVGLFDVWDTCIRTGFQGRNSQITFQEYSELSLALQEAFLQLD